jgi:hypothetical protein
MDAAGSVGGGELNAPLPITDSQRQAVELRKKLMNNPPAKPKVVRTEQYYTEIITSVRYVNKTLREELDRMKHELRTVNQENEKLKNTLTFYLGREPASAKTMKEICEGILDAYHPGVPYRHIFGNSRQPGPTAAKFHCYYEIYSQRDDLTFNQRAAFFKKDQSAYRNGIRRHIETTGAPDILSRRELGA